MADWRAKGGLLCCEERSFKAEKTVETGRNNGVLRPFGLLLLRLKVVFIAQNCCVQV